MASTGQARLIGRRDPATTFPGEAVSRRSARGRWLAAGGLLVALHPRLLVTAERMQPEALAALFLLLFCGWWWRDRPWGVAVAAAWAYLARPEAAALLVLVWIVVQVSIIGYVSWLQPATAVGGLLVLLLSWLLPRRSAPSHNAA